MSEFPALRQTILYYPLLSMQNMSVSVCGWVWVSRCVGVSEFVWGVSMSVWDCGTGVYISVLCMKWCDCPAMLGPGLVCMWVCGWLYLCVVVVCVVCMGGYISVLWWGVWVAISLCCGGVCECVCVAISLCCGGVYGWLYLSVVVVWLSCCVGARAGVSTLQLLL